MLALVRGKKNITDLFPLQTQTHTSQRRNPGSSSCLEAGTGVLSQAEQTKKEIGAKPLRGEHGKPLGTAGMAGGNRHLLCRTLESRRRNEISCLMVQPFQANESNELFPQTQQEREVGKGNIMRLCFFLFFIFPLFLGMNSHPPRNTSHQIKTAGAWQSEFADTFPCFYYDDKST